MKGKTGKVAMSNIDEIIFFRKARFPFFGVPSSATLFLGDIHLVITQKTLRNFWSPPTYKLKHACLHLTIHVQLSPTTPYACTDNSESEKYVLFELWFQLLQLSNSEVRLAILDPSGLACFYTWLDEAPI